MLNINILNNNILIINILNINILNMKIFELKKFYRFLKLYKTFYNIIVKTINILKIGVYKWRMQQMH